MCSSDLVVAGKTGTARLRKTAAPRSSKRRDFSGKSGQWSTGYRSWSCLSWAGAPVLAADRCCLSNPGSIGHRSKVRPPRDHSMTSPLFQPIQLRGLALENRVMVSPMCQYSAIDGCMTDWHLAHLGMLANSGAGLLCFEMTDVEPIGRITPGCSGLYSDANESALERVVNLCRAHGQAKLGIQLAHAGRKASTAEIGRASCRERV